ncbi:dGTP triphosphohydrolase [Pseudodesulfovibrio sediminis]|uniref:Deoxyguanosinetriphosphate triphosphohydrolase n=1 Tax=Pseudodesulfovibrio sediminis TaxID=2810563 RepID=A0ABM7P6R6_9BACT|nr:dNTP triphosphohydrolase [Pseudodesulfovibrio sediminis]BCS88635.1 deoxyguanosinetriphosphate triphosphohydrolase [Pseudodesulfovibrio sediminis]
MASDVLRMDWSRLLETSRYGRNDGNTGIRSPFQKDIDRIIFSDHFRRLARKTQVHPLNENDHIHSRLTHSLEVASVGKSLGELIGVYLEEKGELPEALQPTDVGEAVQAACLAHDIGNPPFGHSGEEAIKDWFKSKHDIFRHIGPEYEADFTRFDGNAMAVRILLSTGFQRIGMSPTYAVIGALLKYPWPSFKAAKDKFSYFQTEAEAMEKVADTLGLIRLDGRYSRPPLAYLTEAADDICYRIIDIEDGTEMGILDEQFMYDRFARALGLDSSGRYAWLPEAHFRQRNSVLRAKLISEATQEAAALFEVYYDEIMTGTFDVKSSLMEKSVTGICRTIHDVYEQTKGTLFLSRRKATLELGAQNALGRLLDQTMADVDKFCHARQSGLNDKIKALIGPEAMDDISGEDSHCQYKVMMTIVDYISGMTDHYATNLCRKLLGLGY